jgi:hypothetical protein
MCGVKASVCQLTPTIYLERFLKEFEAAADEKKKAAELNRKILEVKLHVGKNQLSIAAATVYIAFAARFSRQPRCLRLRSLLGGAGSRTRGGLTQFRLRRLQMTLEGGWSQPSRPR